MFSGMPEARLPWYTDGNSCQQRSAAVSPLVHGTARLPARREGVHDRRHPSLDTRPHPRHLRRGRKAGVPHCGREPRPTWSKKLVATARGCSSARGPRSGRARPRFEAGIPGCGWTSPRATTRTAAARAAGPRPSDCSSSVDSRAARRRSAHRGPTHRGPTPKGRTHAEARSPGVSRTGDRRHVARRAESRPCPSEPEASLVR
jgi:hypothetical protein